MREQEQEQGQQQVYAQTFGRELRDAPSSRTLEERAKTAAGRYIRSKFNGPTETITALEAIDLLTDFHVIMQRAQTPSRISARSMASDDRNAYHAFDELRRRDVEISALRARVRLMKQQIENQAVPEPKPAEIAIKAIEGEGRQFRHELYEEPA
jgi:predicted HNH restriction endonuclease